MLRECVAVAAAIGVIGAGCAQAPQVKANPPASLLDDLIAKSRQVQSFTATFSMTSDDEPAPTTIRCDYEASSGCRVVVGNGDGAVSMWYIDRVLTIRVAPTKAGDSSGGGHARIDLREFDAPMNAVVAALKQEFAEPSGEGGTRPAVTMKWAFDAATNEGEFTIWAGELPDDASPFGWLETLRDKRVEPTLDGDTLRFSTDGGRCDVVVAKENGFLREFVGRGVTKTLRIHLESVALDPAGGMPKLDPPRDEGEGEDLSPAWHAMFERFTLAGIHNHAYNVITEAAGDQPWRDELEGKMKRTLRPLVDWWMHTWVDPWIEKMRRSTPELASRLKDLIESGAPSSDVEQALEDGKAALLESIARAKTQALAAIVLPKECRFPERAARLLTIEREVVEQSFDSTVRDPLLAEFTKVTADARK